MKLKETAESLRENLWKVTQGDGKNYHVHRYDPARRRGKTTIDEDHYHFWKNGEEETSDTVPVPPEADVKPHTHNLDPFKANKGAEAEMMEDDKNVVEDTIQVLSRLNNDDYQSLYVHNWAPKPNQPLDIKVGQNEMGRGVQIEASFYETKPSTATRQLAIQLAPWLEKLNMVASYSFDENATFEKESVNPAELIRVVAHLQPYFRPKHHL
jgi:hypothetical protein